MSNNSQATPPTDAALREYVHTAPLRHLLASAQAERDRAYPRIQTYSPKVFIPLTQLCRDYCHYCTFSRPADHHQKAFLSREQVLEIARAGQRAGCREALFTLGDKPELRHDVARRELEEMGHASTLSYLKEMCEAVIAETGLLPHINAGVMTKQDMAELRAVSASQGLMLETTSERLCGHGMAHYKSPDKAPALRLKMLREAGELNIPFTSGILIGIGETRDERLDALFALRDVHREFGHIQEIIVQNFRAKPGTPMQDAPEPERDDHYWTIAVARLIFGPDMNLQAPPNLSTEYYDELIDAGINDWGGISPVTPDFVNPEAPWPMIEMLRKKTAQKGRVLTARLPIYPSYVQDIVKWADADMATLVRRAADSSGYDRADAWLPGGAQSPTLNTVTTRPAASPQLTAILKRAARGETLSETDITTLFEARDGDAEDVYAAADDLRRNAVGSAVSYAVNRNINYTNICGYKCSFCAFSKGRGKDSLRGAPYDLQLGEVVQRAVEAADRGASEVCLQGGIHPSYTGQTYLDLCTAIRKALPDMHIHAFSPLEVMHGSSTLGLSVAAFLEQLKAAGLNTLPGTAAEILDDKIRAIICPDKLNTAEWLNVMETAHELGLKTTATIMFGHVETPVHWARHLLKVRQLQARTGGFTEFVPLPFVHMQAPMSREGRSRLGPTFREVRLMHAVARLVLHPLISNIQVSWVKLGADGAAACLNGGANDLGGTLMNESISRAAGAAHGQEMAPADMESLITSIGRTPALRTTLYGTPSAHQRARAFAAEPLKPVKVASPNRRTRQLVLDT